MKTIAIIDPPNTKTSESATSMPGSASLTLTRYITNESTRPPK